MAKYADDTGVYTETGMRLPSSYKWALVGMLWCITFFNYADRMALNANMPLIRAEMGLDKTTGGMLGSAFGYSYGLCALFAGFIVDRVRRKNAVLWGLCIWSAICMLTATAHSFWPLFAFLALEGLGEAFYFPAAMSLVSDYHGKKTRSKAMSINQTSVYIGTVLGTLFAGYMGQQWGWRSAFLLFGAMGVVLALVLWRFLHEPARGAADRADAGEAMTNSAHPEMPKAVKVASVQPGIPWNQIAAIIGGILVLFGLGGITHSILTIKADPSIYETIQAYVPYGVLAIIGSIFLFLAYLRKAGEFAAFFKVFFTTPTAVLLLLAFFCANSVAMILLVWMPSFVLETIYSGDIAMLAIAGMLATMPLQIASMFGSPTGGFLADFFRSRTPRGRILVQMSGVLCAVPFVYLCGHAHAIIVLVVALAGWGLFKGIYDSNIFAAVYDVIRPDLRGMAAGFMNMFGWAGGAIAPIVAGYIADSHKSEGLGYAISNTSLAYIVSGLLLFTAAMLFVKRDAARMQAQLETK